MLVTFKTSAYADITMFGSVATTLLKLMGQSGNVPGAVLAEDVPAALETLNAGLKEAASQAEAGDGDTASMTPDRDPILTGDSDDGDRRPVPIATRAGPLIELLEAAAASGENVLWNE